MRKKAAVIGINGAALVALVFALLFITDRYIARRARTTLVYDTHPFHHYQPRPNQVVNVDDIAIVIGAHGMRGEAPAETKAPGEIRVFVMGGSSVFDLAVKESWPERLASAVQRHGGPEVRTFNAGIPGFSSRETVAFYADKVRHLSPDIVLLYQGWNDAKYMRAFEKRVDIDSFYHVADQYQSAYLFLTAPRPARNWYALVRMVNDMSRGERLHEQVTSGRSRDDELADTDLTIDWASTAGMAFWRSSVTDFIDEVSSDGAIPVLVVQGTLLAPTLPPEVQKRIRYKFVDVGHADIVEITDAMTDVLQSVATDHNVDLIDPRATINANPDYFIDHVHLTEKGSAAVADVVGAQLVEILNRMPAPQG